MTDTTTAGAPGTLDQLGTLRALIANDSHAMTFQTFGQYRSALLNEIDLARRAPAPVCADERALFESHMAEDWPSTAFEQCPDGTYRGHLIQDAWAIWQARAAIAQQAAPAQPQPCSHCDGKGEYVHKGQDTECRVCGGTGEAAPAQPATDHATGAARADQKELIETAMKAARKWANLEYSSAQRKGRGGNGFETQCERAEKETRAAIEALAATPSPSAPQEIGNA